MNTALFAGVALNGGRLIDDLQLVGVSGHAEAFFGYDRNLGKQRTLGFPALAATANMVMSTLRCHSNLNRFIVAVAMQISTGEIFATSLNAIVDGGM
jgi:hypothetical protein